VSLGLILFNSVQAQTDPEGELDYFYVVCNQAGYADTGQQEICFELRLVTDNTGGNRIVGIGDVLLITGDNIAAADTTQAKAFYRSVIQGWFIYAVYKYDDPDPTVAPFHMHYGGLTIAGGLPAGDHLIADMCFTVDDTGTICIDTLSTETLMHSVTTENATLFVPGWGGTTGMGYPDSVGICCDILYCQAIPGDANAGGDLSFADVIAIFNYINAKPGYPMCSSNGPICWISEMLCRGDVNGDDKITFSDVLWEAYYIFNQMGGPWDPVPSKLCCQPVP
jgi:hypothetical protein